MNIDFTRSHIGDVHGPLASNNTTTIINIGGNGSPQDLLGRLVDRGNATGGYNSQIRTIGYATSLRAPPNDFFGRDEIRADIVQTLLHSKVKSALVLGAGGIGKTALALTVLHDTAIIDHFGRSRCFVSCEGLDSMDLFLQRLAEILCIAIPDEGIRLEEQILFALSSSNCLICIDNLETLWDSSYTRKIEEMIAKFIHLPTVAVLVTMRGIELPLEPKWSAVHELNPLLESPSSQVFCSAAGISVDNIDEYGKLLVEATDGVPLALTLLGNLIRRGVDTPKDVWKRWSKRKTAILNREKGTRDPHLSVDTSIEFSLESQRVKADPFARATLGILSLLPDGIPRDSDLDIINCLEASIPGAQDLEKSLLTLADVSLSFVENSRGRRYQLLSPIREFTRSRLVSILPRDSRNGVIQYFVRLICENRDYTDPHCFPVRDELVNIHSILTFAYESPEDVIAGHNLAQASINYTDWTVYIGVPIENVICLAEQRFQKDIWLLSDIFSSHGRLHLLQDRLGDSEEVLKQALQIHRQAQSSLGQADDLRNLGRLYMRLNKLDDAEKALTEALELHRQAQNSLGQADDLLHLGRLYKRLNKLDDAKKALKEALELHQHTQSSLGQAEDLLNLGGVYIRLQELDNAERALKEALGLHQQSQSSLGQAYTLLSLGELYMMLNKLDDAKDVLTEALELHQQTQNSLGQADDLKLLGRLYMKLDRLDDAEKALTEALGLHRQAQSSLGQANDLRNLGQLYMRLNRLDDAEKALKGALELHQHGKSPVGKANDLRKLGRLYMRLNKLEDAEKALTEALKLHQQGQSSIGQADDSVSLGELYMKLNRLDDAKKSLTKALKLHQQAQDSVGHADDLQQFGELYMRLNQLDDAEKALVEALKLHQQGKDSLGQANDLLKSGKLYMRLDRPDHAEKVLKEALELHYQAQSFLGQADDLKNLGLLYMRLNKLNDAEKALTKALDYHRQAQDSCGQVDDLQVLNELYVRLNKQDDAKKAEAEALEICRQAHCSTE